MCTPRVVRHILVRNVPLTERDRQMLKTRRNMNKTTVADPTPPDPGCVKIMIIFPKAWKQFFEIK
jgi:hypothetical protein